MRSPFLVTMVVARQRTSRMRPVMRSSSVIQSPTSKSRSSCNANPATTFPSVSCSARPMTAVVRTEAVKTLVTSTSERVSTSAGGDEVGDPLDEVAQDARDLAPHQDHVEEQQAGDDDRREGEQQHRQEPQPVVVVGGGMGGWKSPSASTETRYAPEKKIPALTRPRSVAGTTNLSEKRTASSAIPKKGSDPCADHSCAKRDGKSLTLSWVDLMPHRFGALKGRWERCIDSHASGPSEDLPRLWVVGADQGHRPRRAVPSRVVRQAGAAAAAAAQGPDVAGPLRSDARREGLRPLADGVHGPAGGPLLGLLVPLGHQRAPCATTWPASPRRRRRCSGSRPARVLDIGCNDGTLLSAFPKTYHQDRHRPLGPGARGPRTDHGGARALPVGGADVGARRQPAATSSPRSRCSTTSRIRSPSRARSSSVLAPDGLWCIEMSYMPTMLKHDQLRHDLPRAPRVLQPGGARAHPARGGHAPRQRQPQRQQRRLHPCAGRRTPPTSATGGTSSPTTSGSCGRKSSTCSSTPTSRTGTFRSASTSTASSCSALLKKLRAEGKRVHVYGASTKGNTILQWCGIDNRLVDVARRAQPRQVRRAHAGHRHPDRQRGGIAQGQAGLLPGPALALSRRVPRAREGHCWPPASA